MTTELIVDGNGLVCRLWWANPANVCERFVRAVEAVKPGQQPSCLVTVAWDSGTSWRRDLLPTYKAHRPPKPEALVAAIKDCHRQFYGDDLEAPGFEADDFIGTETEYALDSGYFVVVMSDDKDMAQLVEERCVWLAGGKIYNEAAVIAKFGVPPNRIRHLLSWMGDKVDGRKSVV